MKRILCSLFLATSALVFAQNQAQIIPYPQEISLSDSYLKMNKEIPVKGLSKDEIQIFNHFMPKSHLLVMAKGSHALVDFEKMKTAAHKDFYKIEMNNPSAKAKVKVLYTDERAKMFGFQTLRQLIETAKDNQLQVVNIQDYPKFDYRGMHLDVARHFFNKDDVKKFLDYLAMYKYDKFHWHLTDDQGWRIEIKKYPKLTEVGAWRNSSELTTYADMNFKEKKYGGFYTQDEIKEVVAYAKKLNIDVIPEIEMPGHSLAAIASYPELSCTNEQITVGTNWGVEENILCPKESTFKFYENVLDEVMKLFPYEYIHIGGDEAPKEVWKKSDFVQQLKKELNLKDEDAVQSYFITRIEKYLNSKGRQIIGWDEILQGGLAPNATVMSWTGIEGGIKAAQEHHKAIMTPGETNYFDHYQGNPDTEPVAFGGDTRLEKVYKYNPIPDVLTPEQAQYIWGTQGNLWTEHIATFPHVEYMIFPRMMALSEVAWGTANPEKYKAFEDRVIRHFDMLKERGINYSTAIYEVIGKADIENGKVIYQLSVAKDPKNIRYTIDGSEPTWKSLLYTQPIEITKSTTVKSAYFENGVQKGTVTPQEFIFTKATGKPISLVTPPNEAYSKGGAFSLVDGIKGSQRNYNKAWLGFLGTDVNATIDLGSVTDVSNVKIGVLERQNSWIYYPKGAKVLVSKDNVNFTEVASVNKDEIIKSEGNININFTKQSARYVKVIVENLGIIPDGLTGAGGKPWTFVDEISIN